MAQDTSDPAGRDGAPIVGRSATHEGDLQTVDATACDAQQGRQQGDGSQHGHRDHDRGTPAHHRQHRDAGHLHTDDGQDHRGTREDHREPGGGVGLAGGLGYGHAGGEVLAVAGQDEERVVDADAEGEHQADDGGDLGHRGEAGKDAEGAGADQDRDERDADRGTHGHHGTEGHRQDDGCDAGWRHLATAAALRRCVAEASVVLDLESASG